MEKKTFEVGCRSLYGLELKNGEKIPRSNETPSTKRSFGRQRDQEGSEARTLPREGGETNLLKKIWIRDEGRKFRQLSPQGKTVTIKHEAGVESRH